MKNAIDTSVGDCERVCETDQDLHIAPCSECDLWDTYEALWQTPFGLFCEECFHEQIFIPSCEFKGCSVAEEN